MKKVLGFISVFLFSLIFSQSVFALEEENIDYNGNVYSKDSLSEETLEWIAWYNDLSDEARQMVSYVPEELYNGICSYTGITTSESVVLKENKPVYFAIGLLPTSGYEPIYNPDYWNSSDNIKKANCYAYAMDVICGSEMKLQPGQLSGKMFTSLTEKAIFTAVSNDGLYLGNGRSIRRASKDETPGVNEYKVALVIAPNKDYHWYIQNRDGYWSHKPGYLQATDLDAGGNKITDPQTCNRNYDDLNYSTFCGYYIVTRK